MSPRSKETEKELVKVATFNINNLNKRLPNLLAWLAKAEPDVVSLQELKAEQGDFPRKPFEPPGTKRSGKGNGPGTAWPFSRDTTLPC
jgi:exonuclease III